MRRATQKEVSAAFFSIFIIKFNLAETNDLGDKDWLKDLFEKMIAATGLKVESSYLEGGPADDSCLLEGQDNQAYRATQFFNGGFLNLLAEPEENSLFLFFSSTSALSSALLDCYDLEKIAKLAVPSAEIITRKNALFF